MYQLIVLFSQVKDMLDGTTSNKYWINVQLRWGDLILMILNITLK